MNRLGAWVASFVMAGVGSAQVTQRIDVDWNGAQGTAGGDLTPGSVVSADGRFVTFMSSSQLVPGDTNGNWDIFVRDRLNSTTERVSVATGGLQGNGFSGLYGMWISPDGRFVAFESRANNLVTGDTNGASDVFVRDRLNRTTERVSIATGGSQGNGARFYPSLSADGRYVAFTSEASNLVPGDSNGNWDVFVRDRQSGTTDRVSLALGGAQGDSDSYRSSISADGRFVVFESFATNLVAGDTNGTWDVFVYDRQSATTERVSVDSSGAQGNGMSWDSAISETGRYVAFTSAAANLVPGDTNGWWDVFVRDRQTGTTERMSVGTGGAQGNSNNSGGPSISADGRYLAFSSAASNLVPGPNGCHILVRDRLNRTTERVSLPTDGTLTAGDDSQFASISPDGRYVAFRSLASNLVPGDTNGLTDVFFHDREATGFTGLCSPGVGGVIACPCSNPPAGTGRGCDNSAATGGAILSASGIAYLMVDSLAFTTSAEPSTALSVLMQGNALVTNGIPYGQGVRCAGGSIKRLFVKAAVAGSITAPDFGSGDPTISARSAAKGDVIQAGQSRWYLVYYRDPTVLGGCPAGSTFNSTQTGQVSWWP